MKDTTLFNMLTNQEHRFVVEEDLRTYSETMNRLFITFATFLIIAGIATTILGSFINLNQYFNFNDYASLIFGNVCFIFSFVLLKHRLFFHASNNPITIIGLIFPAFFNARLLTILTEVLTNQRFSIFGLYLVLSIVLYYVILNAYYHKVIKND